MKYYLINIKKIYLKNINRKKSETGLVRKIKKTFDNYTFWKLKYCKIYTWSYIYPKFKIKTKII